MTTTPDISVVIAVFNEEGNILPLVEEIDRALSGYEPVQSYEVVFVDDNSSDATPQEIHAAMKKYPNKVRHIKHASRMGKTRGVRNGVRSARSEWIVTMDGDRQNDPADIPRVLDIAWDGGHNRQVLVSGVRVNRQDTSSRRYASRFANWIRRSLLDDDCQDTGCALKAFRRETYLELPYFEGLHRFEPAMFKLYGHKVLFTPVNDRKRTVGTSKYTNFGRTLIGLVDLFGVYWLQRRTLPPERGHEEV